MGADSDASLSQASIVVLFYFCSNTGGSVHGTVRSMHFSSCHDLGCKHALVLHTAICVLLCCSSSS